MEPNKIFAGSSLSWTRSISYDSGDGYSCEYYLYNGQHRHSLTTECSLDGTTLTVTAATNATAAWAPGSYQWVLFAVKSGERIRLASGWLQVEPDITASDYDGRTHTKRVLDSIEAVIEQRATKDQEAYSIAGRSLSRTPIEDLVKLRDKYRQLYQQELDAEKVANGLTSSKIIRVRF